MNAVAVVMQEKEFLLPVLPGEKFYQLFEEKYSIAFVRRSTVGVVGQFCGRFRLLGIQKY